MKKSTTISIASTLLLMFGLTSCEAAANNDISGTTVFSENEFTEISDSTAALSMPN